MAGKRSSSGPTTILIDSFEAAKILGVSVFRLKQLARAGEVLSVATLTIGRIYRRRDVEEFAVPRRSRTAA